MKSTWPKEAECHRAEEYQTRNQNIWKWDSRNAKLKLLQDEFTVRWEKEHGFFAMDVSLNVSSTLYSPQK